MTLIIWSAAFCLLPRVFGFIKIIFHIFDKFRVARLVFQRLKISEKVCLTVFPDSKSDRIFFFFFVVFFFFFLLQEMISPIPGLFVFSNFCADFFLRSEICPNIQQSREKELLENSPVTFRTN